ncbi:MAG: hypothetical protein BECKG1743D_GA0114223_100155 [Candidatus Kentron sp. G]|nr:MAG: hypothetical protein BECKG1743F_GA0114225_100373 [Candidatus Kentron sp. G]VFM95966.1 MAG: hypothetical protein BECKG1743E_GA0114224_100283 [Candidatus Kentron sp. G]VFM96008.1 MAG: hypothetical protein BECKG1743F_GA0114225_101163 [Candidatus Kentron sp. G]VFM97485.1 MAG: hypothetical protein BECKG1743D_GA0114223_100155 [Candidatus Kentron sp. G]
MSTELTENTEKIRFFRVFREFRGHSFFFFVFLRVLRGSRSLPSWTKFFLWNENVHEKQEKERHHDELINAWKERFSG